MREGKLDLPDIFNQAIQIEDVRERENLIQQLADGDRAVCQKIYRLIRAYKSGVNEVAQENRRVVNPPSRQQSVLDSLATDYSCTALFLKDDPKNSEAVIRPSSPEIPNRSSGDRY